MFRPIVFSADAEKLSKSVNVELAGYHIPTSSSQPRLVRVGLIQNKIVAPTNAPIKDQVCFIFKKFITFQTICGILLGLQ